MAQAYRMTGERSVAEDLVSETIPRVLRSHSNGNGPKDSMLRYEMVSLCTEATRAAQFDIKTTGYPRDTSKPSETLPSL